MVSSTTTIASNHRVEEGVARGGAARGEGNTGGGRGAGDALASTDDAGETKLKINLT